MRGNLVQTRSTSPTEQGEHWSTAAACAEVDTELFYPEQLPLTLQGRKNAAANAKAICNDCPVRQACLDDTMAWEAVVVPALRHGIFGGLDYMERGALAGVEIKRKRFSRL